MTDQNKTDHISWTKGQIAQIQAAFFYGYCSSCALFGLFADRVGPRIIIGETNFKASSSEDFLATAVGGSGALNLLFAYFARKDSITWLVFLRVFQGKGLHEAILTSIQSSAGLTNIFRPSFFAKNIGKSSIFPEKPRFRTFQATLSEKNIG